MVTLEPRLLASGVGPPILDTNDAKYKVDAKTSSSTLGEIFALVVETLVIENSQDFSV